MKPKLIVILGPTASGKTALAIKLAKKINGEIVSADSRQIYRGMDIGTAKPRKDASSKNSPLPPLWSKRGSEGEFYSQGIKHYLIDIKNPDQSYTLAQFKGDALKAIRNIAKRKKLPFLVGGTGLYVSAIVDNLEIPKVKPNRNLRKKLERQMKKHGINYLFGKLTALDPEAAYIVDPKNPRRVIRALEIAILTGRPFSQQRQKGKPLFDSLILGIDIPETKLKTRILKRSRQMIKAGLLQEVKTLVKTFGLRRVPFDAIGYREIVEYLKGKRTLPEALDLINRNTQRFARRQMSWFKKLPVRWLCNQQEAEEAIKKFLSM